MKQVQQPERLNGVEYSSSGFEAECANAKITVEGKINERFYYENINNRRFVFDGSTKLREIMQGSSGLVDEFIISGDKAKNGAYGSDDNKMKSLECMCWTNGSKGISDDFNLFRDKLLQLYNFIILSSVEEDDKRCEFTIEGNNNEKIVIEYIGALTNLENTIFQATLSVDKETMLSRFSQIYTAITDEHIPEYRNDLNNFNDLFNYLVYIFLNVYQNKVGKLYDTSWDRKNFVPLALRNNLSDIISDDKIFTKELKSMILGHLKEHRGDDWIDWETLLNTYIHSMPAMLEIAHVYVLNKITFEIRCFERLFLKARPRPPRPQAIKKKTIKKHPLPQKIKRRSDNLVDDGLVDTDDEKSGGSIRRRKTRRFKKTQKRRRTYKKINNNKKYVREHAK